MIRRFLAILLVAFSAHATMTFPGKKADESQLLQKSDVAFRGICLERRTEQVKGVPIHVFSFRVEEVLKGDLAVGQIFEIRQSGAGSSQEASRLGMTFLSSFHFQTGQGYLLYLGEPGVYGISSVLGGPKRLSE